MVTGSFARGLVLSLVAAAVTAAGCARCDRVRPPLLRADAAHDDALAPDASADAESPAASPLDGERVKHAYEMLVAGDFQAAKRAFAAFGPSVRPFPLSLEYGGFLPAGAGRALLAVGATCEFGDVGTERCTALAGRGGGGTCSDGRLTTSCGTVLVDVADGRVRAFFGPGVATAFGRYLITRSDGGASSVRRVDTLEPLLVVTGDIVAAIDGGAKLVALKALPGKDSRLAEVTVVDPEKRAVSPPCRVRRTEGSSLAPLASLQFRYLPISNRLLVEDDSPYAQITLCAIDSGRPLASFPVQGYTTAVVDASEKTLYVSGVVVASTSGAGSLLAEPQAPTLVDHLAVSLANGAARRIRTLERTADMPGRHMVLGADGETLVVATHEQIRFFSLHPFRALSEVVLEVVLEGPAIDSSYNLTPALTILPDANTLLAAYGVVAGSAFEIWILSIRDRAVLHHGRSVLGWMSDDSGARGAIVLESLQPGRAGIVLGATKAGLVSRPLAPGEGVDAGQKPPPEIAGLRPRTASHGQRNALAEEAALQSLATTMCTLGGLRVPRAVCQQP